MAQLFRPVSNITARVSIFCGLAGPAILVAFAYGMDRGAYITDMKVVKNQPVPFSHKHHAGEDGIDCRYCHTSVETSAFAGIPATEICMSCHSQIWPDSAILAPVRDSFRTGQSVVWTRVHDLPDFVYFNHSIHIDKGIGCATCHGRVDQMPLMYKVNTLYMNWCVNCHRDPSKFIRPRDQIFNMAYQAPANQQELGHRLMKDYHVQSLTDCYTCHR